MVFLFILLVLLIILLTLKFKIEIKNVKFTLKEPHPEGLEIFDQQKIDRVFNINNNFNIKIKFLVLSIIPIFCLNITKQKIEKMNNKFNFQKINFSDFKQNISLSKIKEAVSSLNIRIKEFYLKANIGLDSIMLLTYTIPILSTIISIVLAKKKVKLKNQKYQINPVYNAGNLLNVDFNGIFELNLIHIIKVIYIINKKERVKKNDRTSNRRAYGYSYE